MKSPVEYGEQVLAEMILSEFDKGFSIMSEPTELTKDRVCKIKRLLVHLMADYGLNLTVMQIVRFVASELYKIKLSFTEDAPSIVLSVLDHVIVHLRTAVRLRKMELNAGAIHVICASVYTEHNEKTINRLVENCSGEHVKSLAMFSGKIYNTNATVDDLVSIYEPTPISYTASYICLMLERVCFDGGNLELTPLQAMREYASRLELKIEPDNALFECLDNLNYVTRMALEVRKSKDWIQSDNPGLLEIFRQINTFKNS